MAGPNHQVSMLVHRVARTDFVTQCMETVTSKGGEGTTDALRPSICQEERSHTG